MCLIPKESAKIAEEDIVVYKLLGKCLNGAYYSPWRDAPYEIGKLYTANIRYHECLLNKGDEYPIKTTIIEEGLHAYIDHSTAVLTSAMVPISGLFIVKAIIPRGSMYVLGTGNEIVSTQLKLIEECH